MHRVFKTLFRCYEWKNNVFFWILSRLFLWCQLSTLRVFFLNANFESSLFPAFLLRTCTKNQWKRLSVHTLNSKSFTLDPITPQILWSKKLSGMIWNVSKMAQNEQTYMFFVIFLHKMTENVQKTRKFNHFDSILRRSILFPITFFIEIFEEWLSQE